MNKFTRIAALVISTSLLAAPTFAESFNLDLSGDITDTSCEATISKNTLNLGVLNKSDFSAVGTVKRADDFYIAVKKCPSIMKTATVTINGLEDVSNSELFALDGSVSGLAIQIKSSNQAVAPNAPKVVELNSGEAIFPYNVSYVSTAPTTEIQGGKAHAALNVDVTYQ